VRALLVWFLAGLALVILPGALIVLGVPRGPWREREQAEILRDLLRAAQLAARQPERIPPVEGPPRTSTEVFNAWIRAGILEETDFGSSGNESMVRAPDGDGILQAEENAFAIVRGLPEPWPDGAPVVLLDPALVQGTGRSLLERLPRRMGVATTDGEVRFEPVRTYAWWRRAEGKDDILPGLPGRQRLLGAGRSSKPRG